MKKFCYFTIFALLVALPLFSSAQDRPNVRQNKEKPKISTTSQGIKVNKLVKTTDPSDEFSGVMAETYDQSRQKPKKESKKDTKKQEVGAVDEADDIKKIPIYAEPYGFDENPLIAK